MKIIQKMQKPLRFESCEECKKIGFESNCMAIYCDRCPHCMTIFEYNKNERTNNHIQWGDGDCDHYVRCPSCNEQFHVE